MDTENTSNNFYTSAIDSSNEKEEKNKRRIILLDNLSLFIVVFLFGFMTAVWIDDYIHEKIDNTPAITLEELRQSKKQ